MLYPRIIPCLLIQDKGLVKTTKFSSPKYVGDPINAVKIFNEKHADELMILNIDSTVKNVEPDYNMIKKIAMESRMPICYGGGIKTIEQAKKIFNLGIEKISISSSAIDNPGIIETFSNLFGSQSIVVTLDIRKNFLIRNYSIVTHNSKKKTNIKLFEFIKHVEELGAGELVINSVDKDGTMSGYDYDIIEQIRDNTSLPLTVLGGAGSFDDMGKLIKKHKIIGLGAGSLFVFKGRYKAVLINYPNKAEKNELIEKYYN